MSAEPLQVLIVDDEQPARERLRRLVEELSGWAVAADCATGADALPLAGKLRPAVALLDIRMPGMTGIELARHLGTLEQPPAIVFTTAYDEYALEAFDSQAVGYLLKPVRRERLEEALKHASRLSAPQLLKLATTPEQPLAARQHIAARVRDELKLIPLKDVRYFRADQKYVTVRHTQGEDLIDESLRQLEDEFAHDFVRIHRSLLVAIAHVASLERTPDGGYELKLRGEGETLPVSRRQIADLRKRLAGR
jgi:two-component system response regulator AlgR